MLINHLYTAQSMKPHGKDRGQRGCEVESASQPYGRQWVAVSVDASRTARDIHFMSTVERKAMTACPYHREEKRTVSDGLDD